MAPRDPRGHLIRIHRIQRPQKYLYRPQQVNTRCKPIPQRKGFVSPYRSNNMRHISWKPEIPYASTTDSIKVIWSNSWSRRSIKTSSHPIPICSNEIRIQTHPGRDPKESTEPHHQQTHFQNTWWSPRGSTRSALSEPEKQKGALRDPEPLASVLRGI